MGWKRVVEEARAPDRE